MKKLLVVTFLLAGQVSAETVVQTGSIKVDAAELALAVRHVLPAAQQKAVTHQLDNLERFVRDYVQLKRLGQLALERGLDADAGYAVKLEHEKNRMLTRLLLEDELAKDKQPDFGLAAKESYLLNPERFATPEQVHARHILLMQGDDETEAELRQRAEQVLTLLRKDVSRFSELAKEYSQDPSVAQNEGDLGFFSREQMVKPFSDAAFALDKGGISELVKTRFGYHIIQLVDKKAPGKQSFEEVKEQLIDEAETAYESRQTQEAIARLSGSAAELDEDALVRLQELLQKK